ncbi:fumarylacetoacetate hydrolase family protein [Rhodococcus sp. C3V]|nr:fumarylacetoacetate hydrolase family protein [Rhodococcus sp. C3V]MDF3319979.1 fumarylacetoacetate hydrolase family protein [Rhodococcus sp. C3V]
MRVGPAGQEKPVLLSDDGQHLDLSPITPDINAEFWSAGRLVEVRRAVAAGTLKTVDVTGQRVGAPIARPSAVLCIGLNYAAHAAESGVPTPTVPILFYKSPNTVVGPYDDIHLPRRSTKTDWEVELGVVIGARASYLESRAEAERVIGGYVVSNDVSERDFQLEESGGQWSKGKSCATFNPVGPWLVTPDELDDPQGLGLKTWVNGELRQDSNTADMVFGVADIILHLSQYTVLEPGDLITTGTPEGVALSGRFAYLRAGDRVELEIEGLGRQRSLCIDA